MKESRNITPVATFENRDLSENHLIANRAFKALTGRDTIVNLVNGKTPRCVRVIVTILSAIAPYDTYPFVIHLLATQIIIVEAQNHLTIIL